MPSMPDSAASSQPASSSSYRPVVRLALLLGGGVGVVCGLWLVFLHLTGNNAFGPKQLLAQLLVPLAAVGSEWLLRQRVRPAKPGLGRSLAVGGLTVLIAAVLTAGSMGALAQAVGSNALSETKLEAREIAQLQYNGLPEKERNAELHQLNLRQIEALTVNDLVSAAFMRVLLLGLVLAVPAGIFLRE